MMLKQRVITALLIGLPILAILLFAPPKWITLVLAMIIVLGAWEWSGFFPRVKALLRIAYVLVIAGLMAGWYYYPQAVHPFTFLFVALLWWIAASVWIVFFPQANVGRMTGIAGVMVLMPMWIALVTLGEHHQAGGRWILSLLLLVAATDIGAYFAGRAFGTHKLAPKVSPGKTWEGVVGGLLSAMIVAALLSLWLRIELISFVVLSLVTTGFSIVGDLTESLFKRHSGLKDSGSILPGHGGILDRIDSITAAAPVFVYGLLYLNVVMW